MRHPEAVWTAVLVFFTNLAAVQIVRLVGNSFISIAIGSIVTSIFAAVAVYAKIRLSEARKDGSHDDRSGSTA